MIKLPYGVSDFSDIATEGYYYVDRTSYVEMFESWGEKTLLFIRPRRFGKSLFISMLKHYYGAEHKADFKKFFAKEKESIHYIINTFKTSKSDVIEIVGTLYACWKKLIEEQQIVSDELLSKRFYEWSAEKAKFEESRVVKTLRWMEKKGMMPDV